VAGRGPGGRLEGLLDTEGDDSLLRLDARRGQRVAGRGSRAENGFRPALVGGAEVLPVALAPVDVPDEERPAVVIGVERAGGARTVVGHVQVPAPGTLTGSARVHLPLGSAGERADHG